MENQEKTCVYKDQTYAEGMEVCLDDRCVVCSDGEWEDQAAGKLPPSEAGIPGQVL